MIPLNHQFFSGACVWLRHNKRHRNGNEPRGRLRLTTDGPHTDLAGLFLTLVCMAVSMAGTLTDGESVKARRGGKRSVARDVCVYVCMSDMGRVLARVSFVSMICSPLITRPHTKLLKTGAQAPP